MKKFIIFTLLLAIGTFVVPTASAQSFTSVQYSMGIPTGGLKTHVDKISWRGFTFEYQKEVAPSVSVGVNFAWSTFYERKDYDSYTRDNATLSGVQYRYDNLFPMLVNAHYTIGTGTEFLMLDLELVPCTIYGILTWGFGRLKRITGIS